MTDDLLTTLRERLAECEADAEKLRAAIAAVEGAEVTPAPRKPAEARRTRQSTASKVADTSTVVVPLGKVMKAIKAEPGQTTTTLAKNLGGDQSAILALLKEQEAEGKVRREGERRATKWFTEAKPELVA